MAFAAINKAPGVYIDEIQVPGPIAPAGTSTTAFVGPAQMGPLNKPTFLTNAEQFLNKFGTYIEDPQRVYVTHAVNGFFSEGGGACYFVRVGTGVQAWLTLKDRGATAQPVLVATALTEGKAGNDITVQVEDGSIASTSVTKKQAGIASATGTTVTMATAGDEKNFLPGDMVIVEEGANSERAVVASIAAGAVLLTAALVHTYGAGDIRLADLAPGQQQIRLDSIQGIEPGTYVSITQGGTTEAGVVRTVNSITNRITLTNGLANAYGMKAADAAVTVKTLEFTLTVVGPKTGTEVFKNLSMDPRHSRYFGTVAISAAVSIALADPPSSTPPAKNLPAVLAATKLAGGADDDISAITTVNYHKGIDTLLKIEDVNLLCVPDAVGGKFTDADTQDIQSYMVAHCEKSINRFAILDPVKGANTDLSKIVTQRNNLNSERGMASLYFPWIDISNPLGSGRVSVPPSGHVAGVYAQNDNTRGVFKAPANEPITMALDLENIVTDDEQGPLNEQGINVIRSFPGKGILIWGARTIAPSDVTQWRYNSIRRFTNFVEASLRDGTRFAVFEPNNPTLWGTITRLVKDFLTTQWNEGALEGVTPDKGFSVRVDAQLNPPEVIALGQLIIEVKLFTVPPAEFVVFRIIQQPGGSSVSE